MVQLLFDANMSRRTAEEARSIGSDAIHVSEIGMGSVEDIQIYETATRQGRILVTFDLDFVRLMSVTAGQSASIIVFRLTDQTLASVSNAFLRLFRSDAWALLQAQGMTVIVSEHRIRVRS